MAVDEGKSRGKQYFEKLNRVLNAERVDEVDVILCVKPDKDRCPFLLVENKLGIMSWCVKDLFCFVYKELASLKRDKVNLAKEGDFVMGLSQIVLLLHAEDYTTWNLRKRCIMTSEHSPGRELEFCSLVLTKHPRSSESFSHRRWVINHLLRSNDDLVKTTSFLAEELQICSRCAKRYRDNYTAWSHRCWVIDTFMMNKEEQLRAELRNTEHWLWLNVSDYCGYHFRQRVLEKLGKLSSAETMEILLTKEYESTEEIIRRYPGHETIWYHRRFLISFWFAMSSPCLSCLSSWLNNAKAEQTKEILKHYVAFDVCRSGDQRIQTCQYCPLSGTENISTLSPKNEINFCHEFMVVSNRSPEEERQAILSSSHLQWLKYFLHREYLAHLE